MRRHHRFRPQHQHGFSGVLVVMALILLSSLVVFGVNLMNAAQSSYGQELNDARARLAAEAGMDWARYQLKRLAVPNCPVGQNLALPGTLAPFTVTVACTREGPAAGFSDPATVRVYTVRVTACRLPTGILNCGAGVTSPDYVEKTITDWIE